MAMVDYMLWPFVEREGIIPLILGSKLPNQDDHIPYLSKWKKAMFDYSICAEIYTPPEIFWKLVQHRLKGTAPDYDNLG
ncbi:hypothetical protein NQ314_009389 [Rhamnusium bicolor]|uniref:Uncharacterized protein n=1 Tax=Rhamnusium bicolor TaxID=1586634 RepID=A0AAV8Y006_9CUCU|nr:hypothetical protein NQ314_009389 [Rhamnusium bicolor]